MKVDEFIDTIFSKFVEKAYKEQYIERSAFDPISKALFKTILNSCLDNGNFKLPYYFLAKNLCVTKRQIQYRIPHLARYGLIKVIHRKASNKFNYPNLIITNPILMGILKSDTGRRSLGPFIDHYHKLGTARLECECEVQGFFSDCLLGDEETDNKVESKPWQDRLIEIGSESDKKAASKREDDLRWADLSKRFVDGCGALWTHSQGEMGYGYNQAVWAGDISTLGPTPKKERVELVKLFQTWGGFRVGVAWYIFCCGIPQKDERGRLQFDLRSPHRQFVTTDKKPSQFAKHFNAILADDIYVELTTKGKDEVYELLKKYFNNLVDIEPRFEIEKNVFV